MPQVIRCPHCSKTMQVPDNAAGKQVRCPSCKQVFMVGAPAPQPVGAGVAGGSSPGITAPRPGPTAPSSPSVSIPPAPSAATTPTECPACKSTLLPGAIACMDCGYLIQAEGPGAEAEGPPNLCTNPACGVANPPGERNCQRCGNP